MDIDGILDDTTLANDALVITPAIRDFLSQGARWGKFIAIVGLIGMGLMLAIILLGGGSVMMMMAGTDFPLGSSTIIILIYVAFMALFIMPFIYLYNFSSKIKVALRDDNQTVLTDAFQNLKSLLKFYGVIMAIIVGLNVLAFVLSLLGGLAAALAI